MTHYSAPNTATCPTCRGSFQQRGEWQKVCPRCYAPGKQKARDNVARLRQTVEKSEIKRLEAEVARWKSRALHAELYRPAPTQAIPGDMLARLIRLCHPDKHRGSQAANEATAWLLARRPQKDVCV